MKAELSSMTDFNEQRINYSTKVSFTTGRVFSNHKTLFEENKSQLGLRKTAENTDIRKKTSGKVRRQRKNAALSTREAEKEQAKTREQRHRVRLVKL